VARDNFKESAALQFNHAHRLLSQLSLVSAIAGIILLAAWIAGLGSTSIFHNYGPHRLNLGPDSSAWRVTVLIRKSLPGPAPAPPGGSRRLPRLCLTPAAFRSSFAGWHYIPAESGSVELAIT
jgi:hypothetical protein